MVIQNEDIAAILFTLQEKNKDLGLVFTMTEELFYTTTVNFFNVINRDGAGDIIYKSYEIESLQPFVKGYREGIKSEIV